MEYILETKDLVKSYQGNMVVDHVDIHVKQGEIYGFVGPNGAGKSTIMKMLLNLTRPDSGEIYIFGEKIEYEAEDGIGHWARNRNRTRTQNGTGNRTKTKTRNRIRENNYECLKRIGSIIESPYFYEKNTARQNLELHCEYMGFHNKERVDEVLQLVGLRNIDGKAVSHFSMGMKQRLAIARAILAKPEFLILDEPINALDPEGIREMRTLFCRINQEYGTTIFISSHILSEVEQIADTIGMIQKGKLLKEVSMSEIHHYQTDYIDLEVDDVKQAGFLLDHELDITDFNISSNTNIKIYSPDKTIKEISMVLVQNGVGILGIGKKQNSLEDYFFHMMEEV